MNLARTATNLVLTMMVGSALILTGTHSPVSRADGPSVTHAPLIESLVRDNARQTRELGCKPTSRDRSLNDRVIIREDGRVSRVSFDELAHLAGHVRTWVVGACSPWRPMPHSLARVGHAACYWSVGPTTAVRCPDGFRTTS